MILSSGFLIYFLFYFVSGNELFVNIDYGNNQTFIFYYNLTTNYSYYLTFRLFEHEQIKFGLFSNKIRENTFLIFNQYDSSTTIVYLFIICFHFIHQLNDIDIQCKDLRLLKPDLHLPSYKPLFVPMMYALSILMLLPVIIQHRRRKHAQFIERRTELRHLSISIGQDNPSILSKIAEHGIFNLKNSPSEIELVSLPSKRTIMDNNDNVRFKVRKPRIFVDEYKEDNDNEQSGITADDCIAHLLNSTPWNSTPTEYLLMDNDSTDIFQEQRVPMMTTFYDNRNSHSTVHFFQSNPAFIESDV
jgi:hypothetical protein